MSTYITAEELEAVQTLHKRTPYVIGGVSRSYFSTARHYGGMTMHGSIYLYMPAYDELIRNDVLKMVMRIRRQRLRDANKLAKGDGLGFPLIDGAESVGENSQTKESS